MSTVFLVSRKEGTLMRDFTERRRRNHTEPNLVVRTIDRKGRIIGYGNRTSMTLPKLGSKRRRPVRYGIRLSSRAMAKGTSMEKDWQSCRRGF